MGKFKDLSCENENCCGQGCHDEPKKDESLRLNSNKLGWHNFPLFLMRPLAKVGHHGAKKYDTFNFLKGFKANSVYDSMMRHLDKFTDPAQSDYDEFDDDGKPGSKEHHLAHVAWNALVLLYHLENTPNSDDRFKGRVNEDKD